MVGLVAFDQLGDRRSVVWIGVVDLGSSGRIRLLHVGLAIGGERQVTTLASAVSQDNRPVFERLSATFLATNPLAGR